MGYNAPRLMRVQYDPCPEVMAHIHLQMWMQTCVAATAHDMKDNSDKAHVRCTCTDTRFARVAEASAYGMQLHKSTRTSNVHLLKTRQKYNPKPRYAPDEQVILPSPRSIHTVRSANNFRVDRMLSWERNVYSHVGRETQ